MNKDCFNHEDLGFILTTLKLEIYHYYNLWYKKNLYFVNFSYILKMLFKLNYHVLHYV